MKRIDLISELLEMSEVVKEVSPSELSIDVYTAISKIELEGGLDSEEVDLVVVAGLYSDAIFSLKWMEPIKRYNQLFPSYEKFLKISMKALEQFYFEVKSTKERKKIKSLIDHCKDQIGEIGSKINARPLVSIRIARFFFSVFVYGKCRKELAEREKIHQVKIALSRFEAIVREKYLDGSRDRLPIVTVNSVEKLFERPPRQSTWPARSGLDFYFNLKKSAIAIEEARRLRCRNPNSKTESKKKRV